MDEFIIQNSLLFEFEIGDCMKNIVFLAVLLISVHHSNAGKIHNFRLKNLDNERVSYSELSQNYPNPFNPSTAIRFDIDRSEKVILQIYNNEGRLITTLIDNHMNAGSHEVSWNGKNDDGLTVASGVYYYILKTDGFVTSRKMTFIR
jgi:hypothetical protein